MACRLRVKSGHGQPGSAVKGQTNSLGSSKSDTWSSETHLDFENAHVVAIRYVYNRATYKNNNVKTEKTKNVP